MHRFPLNIVLALSLIAPARAATKLEFNRDIRPILSDNCFACHGFDVKNRKAGLRLDVPEGAFARNEDGVAAILPGKLDASELIKRIIASDPDDLMPPPDSHKKLTPAQIATLKQWVTEGAAYQKHWAFEPPVKPVPPRTKDASLTNPIDMFVDAKLAEHGLEFSPEAEPYELARRITLDLTGLPPIPEEIDAFSRDVSDGGSSLAVSKLVDRLQHSPRYGEHMARYWLDAARYGDTHGLHLDNERSMWPYRDWVVRAYNQNLPFDQFTIWQLAGDLLPNPTEDQIIATGFNRCNVTTSEGGAINEEWIFRYAVDRTDAMMSVWMGLTGGCCVCHDHKYDPITQKEFYSLYAFFNSAADPAMDGNILLTQPILQLGTSEQKKQLATLDSQIAAETASLRKALAGLSYTDPATAATPPPIQTSETVWFDDAFPADAKVEYSGGHETRFVTAAEGPVASGKRSLKRTGEGVTQDFFAGGTKLTVAPGGRLSVMCYIDPDNKPKSIMVQFHVGGWSNRAVWGDEGAIPFGKVRTTERAYMGSLPEAGSWQKLEMSLDKIGLKPGMVVDGFAFTQFGGTVYWDRLVMSSRVNPATDPQWSWSKWIERNQGRRVEGLPNDLLTLVRGKKAAEWPAPDAQRIKDWWFENEYQGARAIVEGPRARKLQLESRRRAINDAIPATLVMADLPERRDAFVMIRGQYDKPGEKVTRATPKVLPPLPSKADYNRLDLARWLTSAQHPLMARVIVNRIWQQFFGTGLVKTSNDLGSQGSPPSHPELLDWMAVRFRETGWDVKQIVRDIVLSRTYRQSAVINSSSGAADPENRWLSHGPRRRLDAEMLRDQSLFVSDLLDQTMGGKPVRPYQPENIWEPVAYSGSNTRYYVQDSGAALYRRSLYTFYKRTAPPPSFTTFDAPSREQVCLRREQSNTPLQALALMNDVQHVEAARKFAERIMRKGGATFDERLSFAFRSVLGRYPHADEAQIMESTLLKHELRFREDKTSATQLTGFGKSTSDYHLNSAELASWSLICSLLLNLDSTQTR